MSIRTMANKVRYNFGLIKVDILGALYDLGKLSDEEAEMKMKKATMETLEALAKTKGMSLEEMLELAGNKEGA